MRTAEPPPTTAPFDLNGEVKAVHVLKRSLECLRHAAGDDSVVAQAESMLSLLADRLTGLLGVEELPPQTSPAAGMNDKSGGEKPDLEDGEELPSLHEIMHEIKLRDEYITNALTLAALRAEARSSPPSSRKTSPSRTTASPGLPSQKGGKTQTRAPAPASPGQHIAKLQSYNAIKDIAQELMGLVAENRGVPVRTLYEGPAEFGVTPKD